MTRTCSTITVNLARFGEARSTAGVETGCPVGDPVAWAVGCDEGAAGTGAGSQCGSVWVAVGLHADRASADAVFDAGADVVPSMGGAIETWRAVLAPFHHRGEVNWLDAGAPGPAFPIGASAESGPSVAGPFAVITSAGWNIDANFDVDRALEFGAGLDRVRASMTAVDGMHSHQVFAFPGLFAFDALTLTFWRDDASMRTFAYRPGTHKTQLDSFRANETADRTSFTRLRALRHTGSWYGTDPLAG